MAAALLVAGAGVAHAENVGCEAMADVFKWTAEGLMDVRNGKSVDGNYIADAAAFASSMTAEDNWPENVPAILDELFMLATAIDERDGKADPGDAEGMLGYMDALSPIATERCGAEIVPVFVRPGVGDARACKQVIKALAAIDNAMPAVRGEQAGMWVLPAATETRKAAGQASAAQWTAGSIDALTEIEAIASPIVRGDAEPGEEPAARITALAVTVAAEARAICGELPEIPMLASAGN